VKNIRFIFVCSLIFACLCGALMLSGCGSDAVAKEGDTVQVDYTLSLKDGTVYQTTVGSNPLELVIGDGNYLVSFEEAIVGMKVGESKTITIAAADAYGEYRDDLITIVERSEIQNGDNIKVGDTLIKTYINGYSAQVKVIDATDDTITIDENNPLAGEDLTFKIDLLKIL
jgi:peptidylprolyl isomerase